MPLEPLLSAQLDKAKRRAFRLPASPSERRERARRAVDERWAELGLPIPEVHTEDLTVPVPTVFAGDAPDVRIRLHWPSQEAKTEKLPVLVTFFGGAFRQGGIDEMQNRWLAATRAIEAGIVVIAVDYALAPEHKAPTQIDQGLAVLDWIAERGAEYGIDASRVGVGGQSSGANLAAVTALANLEHRRHPIRLQILEVPSLDLTGAHMDTSFLRELGVPKIALKLDRRSITKDYLAHKDQAKDPLISPLLREDLSEAPPAVILAAEYDPLRGDAAAYHARLREAGVPSSATIALGQSHDSNVMVGALFAARMWQDTVTAGLRTLHTDSDSA